MFAVHAVQARIESLHNIQAPVTKRADFARFWDEALRLCRERPFGGEKEPFDVLLNRTQAYRVSFEGYDGSLIVGWYMVPRRHDAPEPFPCVVFFHGYPGDKGNPESYAHWLLMDMAVLVIDVRGQYGESENRLPHPGFMMKGWYTQGVLDHHQSYYKAVSLDAVRALDWAASQPEVDADRLVVYGGSQGGGLSLAASALYGRPVAAVVAHVPHMCWMDFGIMHSTGSLSEPGQLASRYPDQLERILETLSYFDVMNLADRIHSPVLMSVGLKDTVCWPETIFAAYHRVASHDKQLLVDPFAGHHINTGFVRKGWQFIRDRIRQ